MKCEPVFNLTLEKTLQVGEVMLKVKVASSNPEISYEELVKFANSALEDRVITSCPGVNIELNIEPNRQSPLFTPAPDETVRYADPSSRPVSKREYDTIYLCRMVDWGYKPYYGTVEFSRLSDEQIKIEVDCATNWEGTENNKYKGGEAIKTCADNKTEQREKLLSIYRENIRTASFGFTLSKEGFERAVEAVVDKATYTHRNILIAMDKDKDEQNRLNGENKRLLKLVTERDCQINELIQQVSKLNDEISHAAKSFAGERQKLTEAMTEYQRRLNVIRASLDAIECVI